MQQPTEFVIELGQSGDQIVQRSGLPVKRSQVSSALLYDASPDRVGVEVAPVIVHGQRKVGLPAAESLLFYDDLEESGGVQEVTVHVLMPAIPDGDDAQQRYYELVRSQLGEIFQRFAAAGWARYIPLSEPRVAGRDSYDLKGAWGQGRDLAADPAYLPEVKEWASMGGELATTRWTWYADGIFANLSYDIGDVAGGNPGGIRVSVQTERMALQAYDPAMEGNWEAARKAYQESLPEQLAEREARETEARTAGVRVLQDWRDPTVAGAVVR